MVESQQVSALELWVEKRKPVIDEWQKAKELQKEYILSALVDYGIKREDISIKASEQCGGGHYKFNFPYDSFVVCFTNEFHENGVSILNGAIHKKTDNPLEQMCLEDMNKFLHEEKFTIEEKRQFRKEFDYRRFHMYIECSVDQPEQPSAEKTIKAMGKIISLAKMPIEEVLNNPDRIQMRSDCGCISDYKL